MARGRPDRRTRTVDAYRGVERRAAIARTVAPVVAFALTSTLIVMIDGVTANARDQVKHAASIPTALRDLNLVDLRGDLGMKASMPAPRPADPNPHR
jgi:hypothetical protein